MKGVSYEFSARTVDDAVAEGLRQLNARRNEVEIEVLHEGSRGLLGIGSTNARVRITLPPEPEPQSDQMDAVEAERRSADEEIAAHTTSVEQTSSRESPMETGDPAAEAEHAHVGQADAVTTDALSRDISSEDVDEEEAEEEDVDFSTDEYDEDEYDEDEYEEDEYDEDEYEEDEGYDEDEDLIYGEVDREELEELASGYLSEMLSLMGFHARIEASWPEDDSNTPPLNLNVVGDDLGILIGRHGDTLSSIQYLVRLMVNQRIHRWTNIVVDVDGYKQRRADQLRQMAQRMAQQVTDTGRAVALEPMPANERRLVHMALRNHPDVYTESTGEAERRKVQILPK